MSYWDAYLLPIPIRKLMLQQFIESQKTEESNPEPLNLSSKEKYKAQSAPAAQQNKVEKKITPPSHVASMYKSSKKA